MLWHVSKKSSTQLVPEATPPAALSSCSQTLRCQLLGIIPVLVDLCQRANKACPLIVSGNCNLLGGGDGTKEAWLKLPVQVSDRKCYLHARVEEVKESHLPNLVDENSSIRVSHCDFSARMPPSEFIKGWITVYYHTGSGHLKQQRRSD